MAECEEKKVILEKINAIVDRLCITECETNVNVIDIQSLKENKASTDEKFNRIFDLLGEIKDAIKVKNNRLPNFIYTVGGMITGSVVVSVLLSVIAKYD